MNTIKILINTNSLIITGIEQWNLLIINITHSMAFFYFSSYFVLLKWIVQTLTHTIQSDPSFFTINNVFITALIHLKPTGKRRRSSLRDSGASLVGLLRFKLLGDLTRIICVKEDDFHRRHLTAAMGLKPSGLLRPLINDLIWKRCHGNLWVQVETGPNWRSVRTRRHPWPDASSQIKIGLD